MLEIPSFRWAQARFAVPGCRAARQPEGAAGHRAAPREPGLWIEGSTLSSRISPCLIGASAAPKGASEATMLDFAGSDAATSSTGFLNKGRDPEVGAEAFSGGLVAGTHVRGH